MATAPAAATDPYRVLQVAPNADLEAIHAAYRRLARRYHPDLNPQPEAAERMRAINVAYAILADPARRAALDARRYLPRSQWVGPTPRSPARSTVRPVVVASPPPTALQRRVDRIVAVLGVALVVAIGFYTVNVIPYAEKQFQSQAEPRAAALARQAPVVAAPNPASERGLDHSAASAVPLRLLTDAGLKDFPGTVLVAPSSLQPFASLPILRLDAASRGIARYAVYYGDLTNGGATISGLIGPASFDGGAPRLAECASDAPYCAGLVAGQPPGPAGLELFRMPALVEVIGSPAFVTHRVCCNGVFWSVSWYEPRANMSYTIDLSRSVAMRYGGPAVTDDETAARAVAELAPQLVRLP